MPVYATDNNSKDKRYFDFRSCNENNYIWLIISSVEEGYQSRNLILLIDKLEKIGIGGRPISNRPKLFLIFFVIYLGEWRNGRRAGLRNQYLYGVWVRIPPCLQPIKDIV